MLYTLTYKSIEIKCGIKSDMEDLLLKSRSNNIINGITGCLIYHEGGFIQILEGDKKKIYSLFEKIKLDTRHTNVNLFSEVEIEKRVFPNWGMAYYTIDKDIDNQQEFEQFKRNLLMLAELNEATNLTAHLFWKNVKYLISFPPNKSPL